MDFNLPLLLVSLVGAGLVIVVLDKIFWEPKRKLAGGEQEEQKEPYLVETAKSFLPVLIVVLVLRSFIVEPFQIPSSSMVPTLRTGDFILVNKFTYGIRLPVVRTKVIGINDPQRGDVMVFFPPNDKRYFIKRVIGLPGDKIEYRDKVLYINGVEAKQELTAALPIKNPTYEIANEQLGDVNHQIRKDMFINRRDNFMTTVPAGHYFMMGDNRDNSSDSRVWGYVPEENIVGKAFAKWMYWSDKGSLPSFSRVGSIQ